jgi:hypothetical protein
LPGEDWLDLGHSLGDIAADARNPRDWAAAQAAEFVFVAQMPDGQAADPIP